MKGQTEDEQGASVMNENNNETPEQKLSQVSPETLAEVSEERKEHPAGTDITELVAEPGGHADNIMGPETRDTETIEPKTKPWDETSRGEEGVGESSPTGSNLSL